MYATFQCFWNLSSFTWTCLSYLGDGRIQESAEMTPAEHWECVQTLPTQRGSPSVTRPELQQLSGLTFRQGQKRCCRVTDKLRKYGCLFFFFLIFIYLASPGLSYSMQGLVPWPGIKPGPSALESRSLGLWTITEIPIYLFQRVI